MVLLRSLFTRHGIYLVVLYSFAIKYQHGAVADVFLVVSSLSDSPWLVMTCSMLSWNVMAVKHPFILNYFELEVYWTISNFTLRFVQICLSSNGPEIWIFACLSRWTPQTSINFFKVIFLPVHSVREMCQQFTILILFEINFRVLALLTFCKNLLIFLVCTILFQVYEFYFSLFP